MGASSLLEPLGECLRYKHSCWCSARSGLRDVLLEENTPVGTRPHAALHPWCKLRPLSNVRYTVRNSSNINHYATMSTKVNSCRLHYFDIYTLSYWFLRSWVQSTVLEHNEIPFTFWFSTCIRPMVASFQSKWDIFHISLQSLLKVHSNLVGDQNLVIYNNNIKMIYQHHVKHFCKTSKNK